MVGVEIGMVGVEIGNPWVLDYGFGWRSRWRWRWLGLVGDGDGDGNGWVWLERVGFFWVWLGWRSVVRVVVFVEEGWVFLCLVEVGGDRWLGWSFLLEKTGFF